MQHEIIILTGMSGAGKSTAIFAFEELKYQCIENPPVELFASLFQLLHQQKSFVPTVISVTLLHAEKAFVEAKKIPGIRVNVVCLVATESELVSRYKLTRHVHPLQGEGLTLVQAIQADQALVSKLRNQVDFMFDSTGYSVMHLRQQLIATFNQNKPHLTIGLVSFGFKHGIPLDADFVFDLRVLTNPYYVPELKNLTGRDQPVIDFVKGQKMFASLLTHAVGYLDVVIPQLLKEERPFYEIAIGCTGGRHRSVVFTQAIGDMLKAKFPVSILTIHRDIQKNPDQE